jgi:hypothetical protein
VGVGWAEEVRFWRGPDSNSRTDFWDFLLATVGSSAIRCDNRTNESTVTLTS